MLHFKKAKKRETWTVRHLVELMKKTDRTNTTFAYLDDTHDYDETQGQKLASGEDILDTCGPAHTVAVHPRQQHYRTARDKFDRGEFHPRAFHIMFRILLLSE